MDLKVMQKSNIEGNIVLQLQDCEPIWSPWAEAFRPLHLNYRNEMQVLLK